MARINFGPLVSDARGKVAGTIFSIWRGIAYAKRFTKPGNPNTALQQAIRTAFQRLTIMWKLMESELITAYTDFAKGRGYTNRNAFIGANVLNVKNADPMQVSPHNPLVFPVSTLSVLPGVGKIVLTWSWPDATAGQKVRLYYRRQTQNDVIFFSEETYPTVTKDITGLTAGQVYEGYAVRKDPTTSKLALSLAGEATPT